MRVNYVPPYWLQVVILSVAALSGAICCAQSTVATGSIVGIVTDPNGSPAGDVEVRIRNDNTGPQIAVRTTATGLYSSGPVIPGDYTVHIEEKGFTVVDFPLRIKIGTVSSGNIRLQPAVSTRKQSNTPNEGDSSQSALAGVISSAQLDTLPLNGRNFLDLAQLEPGIQVTDAATIDPTKSSYFAVSIAGFTGRTVRTLLDGIDLSDERVGGSTQNVAPNAIQEFQVAQAVLDLSSPMTSSGTVNAITRMGTNSLHGAGFYGFRDQRLGFAAFPGGHDSYFQRNQFGGDLGGAVFHDKFFFFASAQRTKQDYTVFPALDYPFIGLNIPYSSPFRDNTLLGRFDWVGNRVRAFYRLAYNEDSDIAGANNYSPFLSHDVAPSHAVGVDFYRGSATHILRFGYSRYSNHSGLPGIGGLLNPYPGLFIQNTSLTIGTNSIRPQSAIQSDRQVNYDGTKVVNNHILRFGAIFNHIDVGGNTAFGSLGATVTGVPTLANQQAILGNPTAYAGALVSGDPVGALDNPLNYPVSSILISDGQEYFTEKSAFGFPRGGLADNRIQLYVGDSWKIKPSVTINYSLHYLRDSGLTNSDLAAIPSLNGFGPTLGSTVRQPNLNFSPELGVAWAPFEGGRTVLRAGAGLYYDSNLFAVALADRSARLQQGQYFAQQPLCGPGEYSAILPNGTLLTSSDGLNIATQICGQPLSRTVNGVTVAKAITDLQSAVQAASAVPGASGFYAGKTGASLGLFSPHYQSPRSLQINLGWDHQFGRSTSLSLNYIRNVGTHYLLAVDRNHVGDAGNLNVSNAINAINRTLAARAPSCGQVNASTSISGINCYLNQVHNASISDFAVNGLDSSGVFANPNAAFPGDNTSLGQGIFFEPIGDSRYRAVDVSLRSIIDHPVRRILSMNLQASYAWSKFQSNTPTGSASGTGNVSTVPNSVDWDNPNGYLGPSGLNRTHQFSIATALGLQRSFSLGLIAHLDSPLPITTFLPELNGGGVPGEIFRSDATGDGTVGDIVPASNIGSFGGGSYSNNVNALITGYNANYAGHATPAGNSLISNGLFTQTQLLELGAVMPTLTSASPSAPGFRWFKTVDVRLAWQHLIKDRFTIEPSVSVFNAFNFANFDNSSNSVSGILQGLPGYSLNGSATVGCGNATCRSADRVGNGSGVFSQGSARQLEFGIRVTF